MMQTFLPYPDFIKSAACLDRKRLGKQRVEVIQILAALNNPNYGWQNHPAVKMWRGHSSALAIYGMAMCSEWTNRGYADTCYDRIRWYRRPKAQLPSWMGNEAFHASHRANLLRKDPLHYHQFGWAEDPAMPYVWPVE
jgi:Pyrimidine dimer DNA glycosylase